MGGITALWGLPGGWACTVVGLPCHVQHGFFSLSRRQAIPALPPRANAEDIRAARDHLEAMLASFLSAGL